MPSLREIEKTISVLFMNQKARQWLDSEKTVKQAPAELRAFDPAILAELDRSGALVYARSINYEHHRMADMIFPFCAKLLAKDWEQVVEDYYKEFPSSHFDFNKICSNFSRYIEEKRSDLLARFPYLAELADYEWLELEKIEDPAEIIAADSISINSLEQINAYAPVLNPTVKVCHYKFPIIDIATYVENSKRPRRKFSKRECCVAIYRDPEINRARFIELGEATAEIVETAQKANSSYMDLLKLTLSLTTDMDPAKATLRFLNLIEELQKDKIFLGSRPQGG